MKSGDKKWPIGMYETDSNTKYMEWDDWEVRYEEKFSCKRLVKRYSPKSWSKKRFELLIPVEFL